MGMGTTHLTPLPPGSGKSSLIAAMANYLCYEVYDLELTKVADNSELRALLIQTTNRSIIVIEDIDCSVDLTADRMLKQKKEFEGEENGRVTLSGLLNFTDGLWSCCGEEKIMVFTTNHRENVDPALVRCGRMDVHVSLGTCGIHAFKELANNYLGARGMESHSHGLLEVVESCIMSGGALTPAQIGEILLRNRGNADMAMKEVVSAMQSKILGGGTRPQMGYCHDEMTRVTRSPESILEEAPENWDSSTSPVVLVQGRTKRKERSSSRRNLLARLKSLTKSDAGRRGA